MGTHWRRNFDEPIRENQSWEERWVGPDKGIIWCWEQGRQKRVAEPELAACATRGELPVLVWKGGVDKKLKTANKPKPGTFKYLAQWQGIRGEDLDIDDGMERIIVCSKTGQAVLFSSNLPVDDDEEGTAD